MNTNLLKNPSSIKDYFARKKYLKEFAASHPNYFEPVGTLIFCGKQGSGKTLSMVNYLCNVVHKYPFCILCTNVRIADYPFNTTYKVDENGVTRYYDLYGCELYRSSDTGALVHTSDDYICIEYDGLDCLKFLNNGFLGVLYGVDEFQLELNSLESKNIDIDVITEICQQRKQRKQFVGCSQVYMRLAKPVREQIFDIVLCSNFFGWLQYNKYIDGETAEEKDGKLHCTIKKRVFWTHKPEYYQRYDTFAKMKRYRNEWQGHKREAPASDFNFIIKGSD